MTIRAGDKAASPHFSVTRPSGAPADTFYPRVEAIRGIAALTVAAFHSWHAQWLDAEGQTRTLLSSPDAASWVEDLGPLFLRVIGNGQGAVILFFVMSGFVLSGSLQRGPQDLAPGAARFLIARLFRIYPAVLATIAAFAVLFLLTGLSLTGAVYFAPVSLLRNAALLDSTIDGVMWSLQIEVVAIPLIFVAYHGWRLCGGIVLVVLVLALAALSFWGPWNRLIGPPNAFGVIHAFAFGIAAFLIARQAIERLSPRVATTVLASALGLLLAVRPVLGAGSRWSPVVEAAFAAVVVSILAFGRLGRLGSFFDLGLIRFFGRISFSFYLLHPLTLIVIWRMPGVLGSVIAAGVPIVAVAMFLFIATAAFVTPLALAMYHWVERPGVAAGRKLAKSLSQLDQRAAADRCSSGRLAQIESTRRLARYF